MDTTLEQFEAMQPSAEEIETMIVYLNRLREAKGEKPREFPDLTLEKQELAEKNESIFTEALEIAKEAFKFLVVKPAKWVGEQIKEHPFRTLLIALAAFALWYYSAPLSAGLSALKEKGLEMTSALFGESVSIDPTQIDIFEQLISQAHGGPI